DGPRALRRQLHRKKKKSFRTCGPETQCCSASSHAMQRPSHDSASEFQVLHTKYS
ncbi:hypothetical protein TorRG33x02_159930, partial [Trema orientale]